MEETLKNYTEWNKAYTKLMEDHLQANPNATAREMIDLINKSYKMAVKMLRYMFEELDKE